MSSNPSPSCAVPSGTLCVSCTDPAVEGEAAVLQDAVVLDPRVPAPVQFVQQSQTLGAFDGQWREAAVVSGHVLPDVSLLGRRTESKYVNASH